MTLTKLIRIAREGSLATVVAVALIAVPAISFAGQTPTTGATTHAGSHVPLPAVHGTDPGNHGSHGGSTATPPSVPGSTTNAPGSPTDATSSPGGSIGMEVAGGVMIGLGILMLLLKDNAKAQSVLQSILSSLGLGSVLNGGIGNGGGILNLLGSLFSMLNGGNNPLSSLGGGLGSLGTVLGGAGSIDNGNVGLNAQRATITTGVTIAQTVHDATQIGFGRNGGGKKQ